MAIYEVETEDGVFEVETEDGNPMQDALRATGDIMGGGMKRAASAGPSSFLSLTGGPAQELLHGVKMEALKKSPAPEYPLGEVGIGGGNLHEAIASGTDIANILPGGLGDAIGKLATRGTDKNITSILKRLSGQESSDIKQLRALEGKRGQGFVLNKTKSKPEYVGREISPKASELASSRVRSMEPEAMREIGIGSEDVALSQELKNKFGIGEFPTKSSADEFFETTIRSAPEDIEIIPNNLRDALADPANKIDNKSASQLLEGIIRRRRDTGLGVLEGQPISKSEFEQIRATLNNLDPNGEIPGVQAIKQALDADASTVIPELASAKGRFQLSRQVPKAELYLDKTKLNKEMSSMLNTASESKNVSARESLKRLLGEGGEFLIDDAIAQRLSKELYAPSNLSTRPVGNVNSILDLIRLPGRFVQRAYEGARSSFNSPKNPMATIADIATPSKTPKATYQSPVRPKPEPVDMAELRRRAYGDELRYFPTEEVKIAKAPSYKDLMRKKRSKSNK